MITLTIRGSPRKISSLWRSTKAHRTRSKCAATLVSTSADPFEPSKTFGKMPGTHWGAACSVRDRKSCSRMLAALSLCVSLFGTIFMQDGCCEEQSVRVDDSSQPIGPRLEFNRLSSVTPTTEGFSPPRLRGFLHPPTTDEFSPRACGLILLTTLTVPKNLTYSYFTNCKSLTNVTEY